MNAGIGGSASEVQPFRTPTLNVVWLTPLYPPGLGLELGGPAPGGGRVVLAPLAGSPAEAAGIQRGDTLLTIGGLWWVWVSVSGGRWAPWLGHPRIQAEEIRRRETLLTFGRLFVVGDRWVGLGWGGVGEQQRVECPNPPGLLLTVLLLLLLTRQPRVTRTLHPFLPAASTY